MSTAKRTYCVTLEAARSPTFEMAFQVWIESASQDSALANALLWTEKTRSGFDSDDWKLQSVFPLEAEPKTRRAAGLVQWLMTEKTAQLIRDTLTLDAGAANFSPSLKQALRAALDEVQETKLEN